MAILCKKNFYCKNLFSTPRKSNSFYPPETKKLTTSIFVTRMSERKMLQNIFATLGWWC